MTNRRWTSPRVRKLALLTSLPVLVFLLVYLGRGDKHRPHDVPSEVPKSVGPVPRYAIVEEEDVSFGTTNRKRVRLRVPEVLSEEQIRAVCAELIPRYRASGYKAVLFYFYLPDSDIKGAHTAGMAEWAPYGSWERAPEVDSGDYSKHKLSVTVDKPVSWLDKTGIPVEKRKKIFYDLVAEEDRLYALGATDRARKARAAIAKRYGLTVEQVREIAAEGLAKNWPIP